MPLNFRDARYLPELLPFGLVTNLQPSELRAVFPEQARWNVAGGERPVLLRIVDLAAAQGVPAAPARAATVRAVFTADQRTARVHLGSAPSWPQGYRQEAFEVNARESLSFQLLNTDTVNPVANLGVRFGFWVQPLEAADLLFWGGEPQGSQAQLAEALRLRRDLKAGLLPLDLIAHERNIDRRRVLVSPVPDSTVTADEDPSRVAVRVSPHAPGEALVLTGISSDAATTAAAADVRVAIDRDGQTDLVSDLPLNLCSLDVPYRTRIIATQSLSFRVYRAVGAGAVPVTVRFDVMQIRLSDLLLARWRMADAARVGGELWNQVLGGVV
jgi:hypothetical protein